MLSSVTGLMKALRVSHPAQHQIVRHYAVPKRKMIRKTYFVYKPKMKSRYKGNPNPRLKMLLVEDVEDVGMKHDIVEVKRGIGRWNLIPNKLAVYATEENLIKHDIDPSRLQDDTSVKVPLNVLKYLKKNKVNLVTPYTKDHPESTWVVTLHDISEYFMRSGCLRVPVSCMNITESEDNVIREVGDYTVQVTLNNTVTVDVPLRMVERADDSVE